MKKPKWKVLSRKTVFTHKRLTLIEDVVKLPNGATTDYLYNAPNTLDSVAIVTLRDSSHILLSQEYSYPPDEVLWQLPGGGVELGEAPLDAARRELREETGIVAAAAENIGFFYTNNRRSPQKQHVFLVTKFTESVTDLDDTENIENSWKSIEEVDQLVAGGKINNINLLAALSLLRKFIDQPRT